MGKGDKKTAKGKRFNASYGNSRSHVAAKATGAATAPVVAKKAATKSVSKAPAKKAVAKKTAAK
jgi:30S ribosomal protein S31